MYAYTHVLVLHVYTCAWKYAYSTLASTRERKGNSERRNSLRKKHYSYVQMYMYTVYTYMYTVYTYMYMYIVHACTHDSFPEMRTHQ